LSQRPSNEFDFEDVKGRENAKHGIDAATAESRGTLSFQGILT
jgi:predicted ATPase with chaperone activity